MKPKPDKPCGKGAGLTWSRRTIGEGVVRWCLFRRDSQRKVHSYQVELGITAPASYAAELLRARKRMLRDQVDEQDLRRMGVAA